jgi:hypothetical protein
LYSTYLGGSSGDGGAGIAVDTFGSAYVTGLTDSADFPTAAPIQATFGGGDADAFVTKLSPAGSALLYSTYLGGTDNDAGHGIAVDALGSAYVTGDTISLDFPTVAPFQGTFGGTTDAFVAKIADVTAPPHPFAHKLSGGGSIAVSGGIATFGFVVQQRATGEIRGELRYENRETGAKVRSVAITSLAVGGDTAMFGGTCTINGAPCTFFVKVTDNGEPGRNDSFIITYSPPGSTEGGMLLSGNIHIPE